MLDLSVAEVVLNRPGIAAIIGEFKAAGVAEHVRMNGELHIGLPSRPNHHFPDC